MGFNYSSSKNNFLKSEIWILAWAGASQRANIFPKHMDEKSRVIKRKEIREITFKFIDQFESMEKISGCLLYTSPSPRDRTRSRMPSSA